MNKIIIVLLFVLSHFLNAQTTDYNTQKGFVAEGYDVVSYFENSVNKGSSAYATTFDGAKFRFSSQENLETFITNPTKYVPQYGGYCAYAVAVQANKVAVDPETFEIRNGKLFLFYNSWETIH